MDDATALKRLNSLLAEDDALQIILPFHACAPAGELVLDRHIAEQVAATGAEDDLPELARRCIEHAEAEGHTPGHSGGYTSVGHYRLVPVKRIEKVADKENWYTAYADDAGGSQCSGQPAALLARLTEHERS